MDCVTAQLSALLINEFKVNTKDSRNNTYFEGEKKKEKKRIEA